MSSVIKILPHYTYDDYCKWEGRWELIDGIPYAMSPAPTPKHQRTAAKIIKELVVAIEKSDCDRCVVYNFIDVKISEDTILQPDALIVCGKISKPYLDFPAALVVEILSPATALKDRNTKFDLYQQFGIPYYLVIDADKKELEIYRLEEKKYQQVPLQKEMSFSFQLEESCMIEVNLQAIWE